MKEKHKENSC